MPVKLKEALDAFAAATGHKTVDEILSAQTTKLPAERVMRRWWMEKE